MTWSTIFAETDAAVLNAFGDTVTFKRTSTGATTALIADIHEMADPFNLDGAINFSEHRYTGRILISALSVEPVMGDTLTTGAGVVYVLDQPPVRDYALYRLVLRRVP